MLNLDQTTITDGGLRHLPGLKRLRELLLNSTKVTDDGLRHLTRLSGLRYLWIANTNVSNTGITEFKKALPNCRVER